MKRNLNQRRDRHPSRSIFELLECRQLLSAGALDPSFSQDGKTTFPFLNGGTETAGDVAMQSDGKVVVAGTSQISVAGSVISKFAVARFNADGTPDKTFGTFRTGKMTFDVGSRDYAGVNAVAIQPDGKILLAGYAQTGKHYWDFDMAVVRLNADGSLDKSFDGDGMRTIDFDGSFGAASDIAVQKDGKIVLVGHNQDDGLFSSSGFNFAVARLNTNGSLDSSFDGDGRRQVDFGSNDHARSVTFDAQGRLLVVGFSETNTGHSVLVTRLNKNGARDATFGGEGLVRTQLPQRPDSYAESVLVQPTGNIVIAGSTGDSKIANGLDFLLLRYLPNGQIDKSFGPRLTGFQEVGFAGNDIGWDVARSADGGLIVAGINNGQFAMAKLSEDGVLDSRFGKVGKVVTDFGADGTAGSIGLAQAPGKRLVIAGGSKFKTARYLDTGAFVIKDGVLDNNLTLVSAARVSGKPTFSSRLIDGLI
jgi:uncharacterized delta-60 repeat protein